MTDYAESNYELSSTSQAKILSQEQIHHFEKFGYVKVPDAFSKHTAEEVKQCVLDLTEQDLGSEIINMDALEQHPEFIEGFFRPSKFLHGAPATNMNTKKAFQALDETLGKDAYIKDNLLAHGLFTMTFPNYNEQPWEPPIYSGSWHIDNGCRYEETYSLESARCACVPVFLVTDVLPTGGATACIPGSHKVMAAIMKRLGNINYQQMRALSETLAVQAERIDTLSGKAGDLVIMHPFLVHSPTSNTERTLRIMSNTGLGLKRGRSYDLHSGSLSPAEKCIAEVVYGLEPRMVGLSRIALKLLTLLRPSRKRFSNHPSWNNKVKYPKKLFLLATLSLQKFFAKVALSKFDIKHFQKNLS